jgi:DNA-binding HxlR family transcriptional regulator
VSRKEFSVYSQYCPSRNVLEGISDKWSILMISLLLQKTYRFGELKREIGGISPKMLTHTLQKLEKYGFVSRQAFPERVMKVEYALTPLGQELSKILQVLTVWTENNMKHVLKAEKKFENRPVKE